MKLSTLTSILCAVIVIIGATIGLELWDVSSAFITNPFLMQEGGAVSLSQPVRQGCLVTVLKGSDPRNKGQPTC